MAESESRPPKKSSTHLSEVGGSMQVPDDPFGESDDDKRLWIGNLDSNVTEYAILKLVQKFGSIRKMDFIYHKAGPDKGKSKGYCFVSFHEWKTAEKARKTLDGKFVLYRPMYVKWARSSKERDDFLKVSVKPSCGPIDAAEATSSLALASSSSLSSSSLSKGAKSQAHSTHGGDSFIGLGGGELETASTSAKIQAIEAKLRLMEQTQKDFGVDATIKAPPGYVPLSTSHKKHGGYGNNSTSRPTPYRRSQPSNSRPKSRRR
ncbi:RNA binding motif protein 18 [Elysia marginata]|uniref:Probable RNA-binding protein 18 n=1 Tax=Elysia marginata TaxID=1093978 RepID=A0AAV4EPR6_9GAST|nr:RNA binding motif protein 18 [Elysia marginata]